MVLHNVIEKNNLLSSIILLKTRYASVPILTDISRTGAKQLMNLLGIDSFSMNVSG